MEDGGSSPPRRQLEVELRKKQNYSFNHICFALNRGDRQTDN